MDTPVEISAPDSRSQTRSSNGGPPRKVRPAVQLDLTDLYCILQIEPNDSLIALELARQLGELGRRGEAVEIFRRVVKIDYRFRTLFALGCAEYAVDEFKRADKALARALQIASATESDLFEVHKLLGNIAVRRGDFEAAEESYNRAHRLQPRSDVLAVNMGTLALQRREWDYALERFRFALLINRANDKAWVGLALGHRIKGDGELAWGNLEAALEYDPRNETALGLVLEWGPPEGRSHRALELIRKYLIAGGWNEQLSLAFAQLAAEFGEIFLARLELERVLAVNPLSEGAERLRIEIAGD